MSSEPEKGESAKQESPQTPVVASPVPTQDSLPGTPSAPGGGRARTLVRLSHEQLSFSGPLPHPSFLKQYEEVVPGAADRILRQAESQTNHRIDLENKVIDSDIRRADRGLWAGLAVAVISIVGGCALVFAGHDWAGATIATATVVSLVGVFVYGSQSRRQERQERAKLLTGQTQPQTTPSVTGESESPRIDGTDPAD